MEVTIAWFWLVKTLAFLMTFGAVYMAVYKKSFQSKVWNVIALVLLVLAYIQPVKMETTTATINTMSNTQIEQQHSVLPPKVIDNSFEESTIIKKISAEDLK